MFTRVVEITSKPGKGRELSRTIHDKVFTILKKQPGFLDELVLISNESPDHVLALSFWDKRENAENYHREQFPRITELLRNLSDGPPRVRSFGVEQSTMHKIALAATGTHGADEPPPPKREN